MNDLHKVVGVDLLLLYFTIKGSHDSILFSKLFIYFQFFEIS